MHGVSDTPVELVSHVLGVTVDDLSNKLSARYMRPTTRRLTLAGGDDSLPSPEDDI